MNESIKYPEGEGKNSKADMGGALKDMSLDQFCKNTFCTIDQAIAVGEKYKGLVPDCSIPLSICSAIITTSEGKENISTLMNRLEELGLSKQNSGVV